MSEQLRKEFEKLYGAHARYMGASYVDPVDEAVFKGFCLGRQSAPEKALPAEPTIEMIAALGFGGDVDMAIGHAHICEEITEQYKAMIAVLPEKSTGNEWSATLELIKELATDLECELDSRHTPGMLIYPSVKAKYDRDMNVVARAKSLLADQLGEI